MGDLKEYIRKKSRELGIDMVGFARAGEAGPEAARLDRWLEGGNHAGMEWIAKNRDRRADPRLALEGARTVVSAAVNYHTRHEHAGAPGTGKISRYAWGDDYHDVLGKKLDALLAAIVEAEPAVAGRVYVDTGPVMEKAWAARAGLGWQGKHTNLISPEYGSWIFLGEILLTAEIAPDPPETDHCGNCVLCIEACPTGAITEPYVLDAGLCISYLTIEHRGPFPPGSGGMLDGWLFGCDVCQEVCPWNDRAVVSGDPAFSPRPGNVDRELGNVLGMGEEEFRAVFRGSPVRRARLEGLKRNAEALQGAPGAHHNDNRRR
jgi:epoxyqueuosine reductase